MVYTKLLHGTSLFLNLLHDRQYHLSQEGWRILKQSKWNHFIAVGIVPHYHVAITWYTTIAPVSIHVFFCDLLLEYTLMSLQ